MIAGPTEATALGNILVQSRAAMRELVAGTQPLRRFTPRGDPAAWDEAAARIGGCVADGGEW